jgi:hypothetical protein
LLCLWVLPGCAWRLPLVLPCSLLLLLLIAGLHKILRTVGMYGARLAALQLAAPDWLRQRVGQRQLRGAAKDNTAASRRERTQIHPSSNMQGNMNTAARHSDEA